MREEAIKLENNLLGYKSWDATELQSPHRQLPKEEGYHPVPEPISQADTLTVEIKSKESPMDGFIYDIINITID